MKKSSMFSAQHHKNILAELEAEEVRQKEDSDSQKRLESLLREVIECEKKGLVRKRRLEELKAEEQSAKELVKYQDGLIKELKKADSEATSALNGAKKMLEAVEKEKAAERERLNPLKAYSALVEKMRSCRFDGSGASESKQKEELKEARAELTVQCEKVAQLECQLTDVEAELREIDYPEIAIEIRRSLLKDLRKRNRMLNAKVVQARFEQCRLDAEHMLAFASE